MTQKWTQKDVLEHARALKSPFENTANGQKSGLARGLEKIKELVGKKKEV